VAAASQPAAPEAPMPVPNLTAKTGVTSNRQVRTSQVTERTTQSVKITSVDVDVRFFDPPPAPYEIQCFFIARSATTGERFVYDAVSMQSQERVVLTTFTSQPLDGGSKTFNAIRFTGTYEDSRGRERGTFKGLATSSSQRLGSKIEGWVVRVVGRGRVLRTESNQPVLKEVAANMTAELDKTAASLVKE
jgi:hypothetical protein